MSLDSLNKEEKDQLSKEVNMELKSIAELMGAQNMRLRRNMDRDFHGFRGDEKIKDFEKQLKELGEESRTVTPEGNIFIAAFVGTLGIFIGVLGGGSGLAILSIVISYTLLLYAGIMYKRNENITSKKDQIAYIEKRIKELKEYGEK
jgi:Flp pilus assembly protein TadB